MAFVRLLCTASRLKKLKTQLVEEKSDAVKVSKHLKTRRRFRHIGIDCRRKIKEFFKAIFRLPEKSCLHRTCYNLRHEGSCENFTLKSVLGFLGGVLLTYVFFIFCVFSLNFKLTSATIFCSLLGCILTIGLAFSSTVRCIVLLTLPQFFSKKGRQALLAYVFILVISGPAKNTLNNLGILSESLACGQEQLKQAVRQIIDVIKKPFLAIRDAIKKVVKAIKEVIKKIKEILLKIKRIIMAIVRVIKSVFEFLGKIINICNKELGTPFERCTRVFENAITDCHAKLGPIFSWLCSITYIVKSVCYIVKIFDFVCMIVDFISDSIVGVVVRKVKIFIRHIRTMFYVRIKFSHSYEFHTSSSKTLAEISKEIVAEIKQRTSTLKKVFDFMTSATTVFFLFMIFQVTIYRYRYLTSERFDNIYITKNFRDIDLRRAKLEKETVLPLNHREEKIYVQTSSGKLVESEKKSLAKSAVSLGSASVKIGAHLAADYCLFWILNIINHYGRFQSKVKAPNMPSVHVAGNGFLADLLRAIVKAFQPVGIQLEIDTIPCLPIPIPPDYDRYVQIVITLLICWLLTLFEPYGLRMRHKVMSYYHPTRAKERTIWLYNHIMRSRNSFLKFARRQLKRKMLGDKRIAKVTCKEYLRANLRCKIFRLCLGEDLQTACLLCGDVFRESDKEKPIRCHTPNCPGVYCERCFADLQNICTICLSPIDYGDFSDIDEEKDSSADEAKPMPKKKQNKKKKCKLKWKGKKKGPFDDDDQDDHHGDSSSSRPETPTSTSKAPESDDSDYHSSATSTDYSYTYQYDQKDNQEPIESLSSFKDVEKQDIPDFASMESYREEPDRVEEILPLRELESDSSMDYDQYEESPLIELDVDIGPLKHSKGTATDFKISVGTEISGTALKEALDNYSDFAISASVQTEPIEQLDPVRKAKKRSIPSTVIEFFGMPSRKNLKHHVHEEEMSLIEHNECDCAEEDYGTKNPFLTQKRVEFIGVPDDDNAAIQELESESSFITIPKSTMSTNTAVDYCGLHLDDVPNEMDLSSSVHTETMEELAQKGSVVPKLDLSPLTEPSTSQRNVVSEMFDHVKCEEISETPKTATSTKSLLSSSVISSLEEDNERQENSSHSAETKTTSFMNSNPFEDSSSSGISALEIDNKQRKKVKDYYKATNQLEFPKGKKRKPPKKKNKVFKFFKKLFLERKRGSTDLPPSTEDSEVIEVTSYNYVHDQWDTFSVSTPTYPFEQNTPQTPSVEESAPSGSQQRIRGGECINLRSQTPHWQQAGSRTIPLSYSRLSLPPNREANTTYDWLQKYFISVEDLTPTKDPGPQMQQTSPAPTENTSVDTQTAAPQDLPEKDKSDIQLHHTEKSSHLNIDTVQSSASSVLSESVCAAILGKPCPGRLKSHDKRVKSDSTTTTADTESGTNQGSKDEFFDSISQPSETSPDQQTKGILRKSHQSNGSDPSTLNNKDTVGQVSTDIATNNRISPDQPTRREGDKLESSKETSNLKDPEILPQPVKRLSKEKENRPETSQGGRSNLEPVKRLSQEPATRQDIQSLQTDSPEIQSAVAPDSQTQDIVYVRQGARALQKGSSPILKVQLSFNSNGEREPMAESCCTCLKRNEEPIPQQRSVDKTVVTRESFPLRLSWSQASGRGKTLLTSDKIQQTSDNDFYHSGNNTVGFSTETETRSSVTMRKSSTTDQTQPTSSSNQACKCPYSDQTTSASRVCTHSCCKCPPPLPMDHSRERSYMSSNPPENVYSDYEPPSPRDYPSYERPPPPPNPEYPPYEMRVPPPPLQPYRDFPNTPQAPTPRHPPRRLSPPARQYPRRAEADAKWATQGGCSCNGECYCCNHYSPRSSVPRQPRRYPDRRYPDYSTTSYATNNEDEDDPQYEYSNPQTDLPYQNNEEYMELVQELEETLHSRNRNRVRRAMEEFENRSRHNRPLDKPIIDYDETSESEEPIIQRINKLRTEKRMCCAGDQCSCRHKGHQDRRKQSAKKGAEPRDYDRSCCHWQMDPGSGEWIKIPSGRGRRFKGNRGRSPSSHDCNCECKYCYS